MLALSLMSEIVVDKSLKITTTTLVSSAYILGEHKFIQFGKSFI